MDENYGAVVDEALENLRGTIRSQEQYLYGESAEIRRGLERILFPLLEWVYRVDQWMMGRDGSAMIMEFREQLSEMRDIWSDDDNEQMQLEFNVELEMDARTSNVIAALHEAVWQLEQAILDDPLLAASRDPKAQPLVDGLRSLAEVLAR